MLSLSLASTDGSDALIVACDDDRYVVVAGTCEKLVEQLAYEEKPGENAGIKLVEGRIKRDGIR